jgi:predicted HicB family RNase H-like nuclease
MTDLLIYKAFLGSVHFSTLDEVFYGKIERVNDLVTFEENSVKELKKLFMRQLKTIWNYVKQRTKPCSNHLKALSM